MTTAILGIRIKVDGAGKVTADLNGVERSVDDVGKTAKRSGKEVNNLGRLLGTLVTAATIAHTIRQVVEYERLGAVMKTVTGSAAAARGEYAKLQEFAKQTPFQLQEIVEAYTRLRSVGLDPSIEAMRAYGNTAAATGRNLMQYVEAVADATTGEFERLKDFGIKASQSGEHVSFTFQGVTTTVKKNAAEIEKYLQQIGNHQFASGMDDQMNTLGGAFSNVQDAAFQLVAALGEAGLSAALNGVAEYMITFAEYMKDTVVPAFSLLLERIGLIKREINSLSENEALARLSLITDQINDIQADIAASGEPPSMFQIGHLKDLGEEYARLKQRIHDIRNPPEPPKNPTTGAPGAGDALPKSDPFGDWQKKLVSDAQATELLRKQIDYLDAAFFDGSITAEQYEREIEKLTGATDEYRGEVAQTADDWDRAMDLIDEQFRQLDEQEARRIAGLEDLRDTGVDAYEELAKAAKGWGREATDAITNMVAHGKGSFKSLVDSILADLVRIQAHENATKPILEGGIKLLGNVFGSLFHDGGVVGFTDAGRMVPALAYAGAARYHAGGIAGDEVPAILRRGEEVLTEDDPRHINNGGKGVRVVIENRGQPIEAVQSDTQFDANGMIVRIVTDDVQRGGPIAGAMSRIFCLRRSGV